MALKREDFLGRLKHAGLNANLRMGTFEESTSRLNYRQTVKLAVSSGGDRGLRNRASPKVAFGKATRPWLNIGLYRPGTHEVFDIGTCAAQDPHINELVRSVRYALKDNLIPVHDQVVENRAGTSRIRVIQMGLRYLLVRRAHSTGKLHLTFVCSAEILTKLRIVARQVRQRHPELIGVTLHRNQSTGNAILNLNDVASPANEVLIGDAVLPDSVAGIAVEWDPLAFAQTNLDVAERMYRRIWELADVRPLETWLDVYCGVGLIGLGAAKRATRVIGIEENAASIERAKRNADLNAIANWSGVSGRAEDLLAGALGAGKMPDFIGSSPVGVVTLNPSRRGCQPEVLDALAAMRPRQIIYMSCDAGTFLRDLKRLEDCGYETRLIENFDMFPGTMHYESLAVMTAKPADLKTNV
jgi:23S rRNA (uracil1939-C5)-methyltransferase